MTFSIVANFVDVLNRKIYPATVNVQEGLIQGITPLDQTLSGPFILPGFIDSHVHIESSMLVPSEFAYLAVQHGTVATVSDPHEIGNVLGVPGVRYMIENGKKVPFKFYFGAPSCVPATRFETAGAEINVEGLKTLFTEDKLIYLSEMMNYPGVINKDPEVIAKLELAKSLNLPIDGHAPLLMGEGAKRYFSEGITTDHECSLYEEGLEKANLGVNIIIREGSAAKNFTALHPLIKSHPAQIMFCSDDKHPDDLVKGHINELVKRALKLGYDLMDILRAATCNPVFHYGLKVGLLRPGDPADFIIVRDLNNFEVLKTVINGQTVFENGKSLLDKVPVNIVNQFEAHSKSEADFTVSAKSETVKVIKAIDGALVTESFTGKAKIADGKLLSNPTDDILKIAVVNRYKNVKPAIGFIQGFNLKKGAIASSVAHDSHNIVAVGVSDKDLCDAVNAVIKAKGGVAVSLEGKTELLELPVAGLMSALDGDFVAKQYEALTEKAKSLGSSLNSPFMTLSFMALLVIPKLKMSDLGLFDAEKFQFTPLN